MSQPENMRAGNATALAAAKWLTTTGRVLPVVTDRLFHTTTAGASTMPLTSSVRGGRFRLSRAPIQSEYTLFPPSDCPTNQHHLSAVQRRNVRAFTPSSSAACCCVSRLSVHIEYASSNTISLLSSASFATPIHSPRVHQNP